MAPIPMWKLCEDGKDAEVRAALARGEDANSKDENNRTGLMWAVMNKHSSVVRLLLEQPTSDLNTSVNFNGRTALHEAALIDNVEAVQLLLADSRLSTANERDTIGYTPVMLAMRRRSVNALRELVANNCVDLDTKDGDGRSLEEARYIAFPVTIDSCFAYFRPLGFAEGETIVSEARQRRARPAEDVLVEQV